MQDLLRLSHTVYVILVFVKANIKAKPNSIIQTNFLPWWNEMQSHVLKESDNRRGVIVAILKFLLTFIYLLFMYWCWGLNPEP